MTLKSIVADIVMGELPTTWYTIIDNNKYILRYDIDDCVWVECERGTGIDIINYQSCRDDFVRCNVKGEILKPKIKKERKMNNVNKETVNYIGGSYKIAKVTYDLSEYEIDLGVYYHFKADIDLVLTSGDLVVVESVNGYGICKVLDVYEDTFENAAIVSKANAWVVDKVNLERHNAKKKATERQAWLVKKLEEKKAQLAVTDMYTLIAETDPEAKKLLEELKGLPQSLTK